MTQDTVCYGFHHVAIRVHDFDGTVKFYTEGLGFSQIMSWGEGDGRAIMLDTGSDTNLEIFAGGTNEPKPEGAIIHFALCTDDCDAALARAVDAGAVVTVAPKSVNIPSEPPMAVRIAFCKTPSGEVVEFFQEG